MKVACVSIYNPKLEKDFGFYTHHWIPKLEAQFEAVDYLHQFRDPRTYPKIVAKAIYYKKLLKKYYSVRVDADLVRDQSRQISRYLSNSDADWVFSLESPGSQPISYLDTDKPIVFWESGNFAALVDFYPYYRRSTMCDQTFEDGLANDKAALERCRLAIYHSEWAASTAIQTHNVNPDKAKIVAPGGNFESNFLIEDVKTVIDARPTDRCKLVFIGVDWERKGGDIAMKVAQQLNENGLPTELSLVGCAPDTDEPLPDYVKPLGFINKWTPEGRDRMVKILSESHFLILPTVADCFPLVFGEVAAFGLPSLSTKVGGVPSAIRDDCNGKTFALDAQVDEYCTYVMNLFTNYSAYKELARSTFHEYETQLNWRVATRTVRQLMAEAT
jgi:glycosyltransferase involved in cell wall biosynthesis